MTAQDLARKTCVPCEGGVPSMALDQANALITDLPGWQISADGSTITRRFEFKGFAKSVEMANLAAWLGNKEGHHPDITFGWGYCEVAFTTHAAKGLTENDFICAARLNELVA